MHGFVIPNTGKTMLARAAAGEVLQLTGVAVGQGVVETKTAAVALTALVDQVAEATSTTPAVSGEQITMIVEYRNDMNGGLTTGFRLSEVGVFAQISDEVPALLYYIALGDMAHAVQALEEGLDIHRFPLAIAVTDEVTVTLGYPANAFLTADDLEKALGAGYIPEAEKGVAGGVATLDKSGKLTAAQRPTLEDLGAAQVVFTQVQKEVTAHDTDPAAHQDIREALNTAARAVAIAVSPDEPEEDDFWIDTDDNESGTLVSSFNGRVGAVVPQAEDYAEFYAPADGGSGSSVTVLTSVIGTAWTENEEAGIKSQTISLPGVTVDSCAKVSAYCENGFDEESAELYAEQQNQFNDLICNGFAQTGADTLTFYIFGDANTVEIPIIVEVV